MSQGEGILDQKTKRFACKFQEVLFKGTLDITVLKIYSAKAILSGGELRDDARLTVLWAKFRVGEPISYKDVLSVIPVNKHQRTFASEPVQYDTFKRVYKAKREYCFF